MAMTSLLGHAIQTSVPRRATGPDRRPSSRPVPLYKGVIKGIQQDIDPEDIRVYLNSNVDLGIVRITRFSKKKQGETIWFKSLLISATKPLPDRVNISMLGGVRVYPYVPTPFRCYKCQSVDGHMAKNCTQSTKCSRCAGNHPYKECRSPNEKCANCSGKHNALSKECPALINKQELLQTAATQGVTITEARKQIKEKKKNTIQDPPRQGPNSKQNKATGVTVKPTYANVVSPLKPVAPKKTRAAVMTVGQTQVELPVQTQVDLPAQAQAVQEAPPVFTPEQAKALTKFITRCMELLTSKLNKDEIKKKLAQEAIASFGLPSNN